MSEIIIDILADSLTDSLKVFPFLFVTYALMELLEHKAGAKTEEMIKRAGRSGPFFGAILGVIPQCGFSAAAAGLYAGGVLTAGTLLAVFLSTSDEMLPIFLSQGADPALILKILLLKVVAAILTGFAFDSANARLRKGVKRVEIHEICEQEKCHCDERSLLGSAAYHSATVTAFLFAISFTLGLLIELAGEETIASFMTGIPLISEMIAALIGLIPNCAASVLITRLYLEGLLGGGAMMAGLFVSAGMGLLVLFRTNPHRNKNFGILFILYGCGVFWGLVIRLSGIL